MHNKRRTISMPPPILWALLGSILGSHINWNYHARGLTLPLMTVLRFFALFEVDSPKQGLDGVLRSLFVFGLMLELVAPMQECDRLNTSCRDLEVESSRLDGVLRAFAIFEVESLRLDGALRTLMREVDSDFSIWPPFLKFGFATLCVRKKWQLDTESRLEGEMWSNTCIRSPWRTDFFPPCRMMPGLIFFKSLYSNSSILSASSISLCLSAILSASRSSWVCDAIPLRALSLDAGALYFCSLLRSPRPNLPKCVVSMLDYVRHRRHSKVGAFWAPAWCNLLAVLDQITLVTTVGRFAQLFGCITELSCTNSAIFWNEQHAYSTAISPTMCIPQLSCLSP